MQPKGLFTFLVHPLPLVVVKKSYKGFADADRGVLQAAVQGMV
jgi:hypothetical protein